MSQVDSNSKLLSQYFGPGFHKCPDSPYDKHRLEAGWEHPCIPPQWGWQFYESENKPQTPGVNPKPIVRVGKAFQIDTPKLQAWIKKNCAPKKRGCVLWKPRKFTTVSRTQGSSQT